MIDYKHYRESRLKRIGRDLFFFFACFIGAGIVIVSIWVLWALLYVLAP
mgnify:CR=1 FL=1